MSDYYAEYTKPFSVLVGETLTEVTGLEQGSEEVHIRTASGKHFRMKHYASCCEKVEVVDVNIVGAPPSEWRSPITVATEESNAGAEPKPCEYSQSWTWTFYRLACNEGTVVLRWLGESNGYYSEDVDFEQLSGGSE
jgi:hypothetical protein